jgi:hypothetical protein
VSVAYGSADERYDEEGMHGREGKGAAEVMHSKNF